jgi:hypothetical protein
MLQGTTIMAMKQPQSLWPAQTVLPPAYPRRWQTGSRSMGCGYVLGIFMGWVRKIHREHFILAINWSVEYRSVYPHIAHIIDIR